MIACVYIFGPLHGKLEFTEPPIKPEVMIIVPNAPSFQRYEFGEPYGPPVTSMMADRHIYRMHDMFDQGTEECAIYFHHEDCCEKDYSHSEEYKNLRPVDMKDLPRFKDVQAMFDRPRPKKRPNLGDPNREKGNI